MFLLQIVWEWGLFKSSLQHKCRESEEQWRQCFHLSDTHPPPTLSSQSLTQITLGGGRLSPTIRHSLSHPTEDSNETSQLSDPENPRRDTRSKHGKDFCGGDDILA